VIGSYLEMEILHSLEEAASRGGPSAVTIGAFDGIHLAHQALLNRVKTLAAERHAASVAITFNPHPVQVLAPEKAPRLLTPLPVKVDLIEQSGIDRLLIIPFSRDFSLWPPSRFANDVLKQALRTIVVVIGDNFHFGYQQAGTPEVMQELGRRCGFNTEILPKMSLRNMVISSSQVRRSLEQGNISAANRLLGRCFSIRGLIEPGLGIGKTQTVPTLNLGAYDALLPASGVYVTHTRPMAKSGSGQPENADLPLLRSVTNIGTRPTFGERDLGVETHLLEPWTGPPPAEMELTFLYRLRDERKFASASDLKAQIIKDVKRAERYFRRVEKFTSQRG
jgi:riboflavin kinase / FMN adenylyltransferase